MLHLSTSPLACAGRPLCTEGVQVAASSPTPTPGITPGISTSSPTLASTSACGAPVTHLTRAVQLAVRLRVGRRG